MKVKGFRAGAFACLGAMVGKGMMEPVAKLTMIKQIEFMEMLNAIQIKFPNFSFDEDQDEQDEEKSFLIAVSTAVTKLGK